jgi:hypothetical protein
VHAEEKVKANDPYKQSSPGLGLDGPGPCADPKRKIIDEKKIINKTGCFEICVIF